MPSNTAHCYLLRCHCGLDSPQTPARNRDQAMELLLEWFSNHLKISHPDWGGRKKAASFMLFERHATPTEMEAARVEILALANGSEKN